MGLTRQPPKYFTYEDIVKGGTGNTGNIIETKSRYEVIADIEDKKRRIIIEKNSLEDTLKAKERQLKIKEREKSDSIIEYDREIEDMKEDINQYKRTMQEKKQTADELIRSMNDSLGRFEKLQEKQNEKQK